MSVGLILDGRGILSGMGDRHLLIGSAMKLFHHLCGVFDYEELASSPLV
jgi:hypothetical protein